MGSGSLARWLLLVSLCLVPATVHAKPPIGDGGDPTPKTLTKDFSNWVTLNSSSGQLVCEVWRDYYYQNGDPSQFVGWAGPPYIKSETCQSIGGDGTSGPDCPPGDIACLCAGPGNAGNPACEGGGPLGPDPKPPEDCVETATNKTCKAGSGASCDTCKAKKKKACDDCRSGEKSRNQSVNNNLAQCANEAAQQAAFMCKLGWLPNGTSVGNYQAARACFEKYGSWTPCLGFEAIKDTYDCGIDVWSDSWCESNHENRDCQDAWTGGMNAGQQTWALDPSVEFTTKVGISVKVNAGKIYEETTTWAPTEGTFQRCYKLSLLEKQANKKAAKDCKDKVNTDYKGNPECK